MEYTEELKREVIEYFSEHGISKTQKQFKGKVGQYTIRCWCIPGWKEQQEKKTKEWREETHKNVGRGKYTKEFKNEVRECCNQHGLEDTIKKYRDRVWPDTIRYWCNSTYKESKKQGSNTFYEVNRSNSEFLKKRAEASKAFRETEHGNEYGVRHRNENKDRYQHNSILHREKHKAYYLDRAAEYYTDNKDRCRAWGKAWYEANKQRLFKQQRELYRTDPLYRLKCLMRCGLSRALRCAGVPKTLPSIQYLGCSIKEFRHHIENQFLEGMHWDNQGKHIPGIEKSVWHLDHIIPLSNLTDVNDTEMIKKLCHYTNYQPLWSEDNLTKHAKV